MWHKDQKAGSALVPAILAQEGTSQEIGPHTPLLTEWPSQFSPLRSQRARPICSTSTVGLQPEYCLCTESYWASSVDALNRSQAVLGLTHGTARSESTGSIGHICGNSGKRKQIFVCVFLLQHSHPSLRGMEPEPDELCNCLGCPALHGAYL